MILKINSTRGHTGSLLVCTMVDPEMFSTMEFFLLIRIHIGSRNKFSLVAQAVTLGNFFNLHKCKMAAARYVNMCYTRIAGANIKCYTSFKGSLVQGIQN